MFPLDYIAVAVQLRNNTVNTGQTAKEGIALPDFRSLLTERLCKAVKTLRRTHDNSAIFPILRNDFQHLRRKVLALVTAEPILHFINTGNHALDTVFIADQKPPIIQFFILATQGEVCDTPGFRVPSAKKVTANKRPSFIFRSSMPRNFTVFVNFMFMLLSAQKIAHYKVNDTYR